MARSNVGSAASLGDLVELLDGVSFGLASTANSNTSDRVPQHSKTGNVDNTDDDDEDSADSGIRKASSYPDLCTNKAYLARHQVCMVNITPQTREDEQVDIEDCSDDEEESYDKNGNVKINVDHLEWNQGRAARETAGNANAATARANGAPSTPGIGLGGGTNTGAPGNRDGNTGTPVNGARARRRPLLELSQAIWDKAKEVFENRCFSGLMFLEMNSWHTIIYWICKKGS